MSKKDSFNAFVKFSKKESLEAQPEEEIINPIQNFEYFDSNNDNDRLNFLEILPVEILHKIFNLCELRDQLILVKVSTHSREIIREIYKTKYKFLYCNCFKDYKNLKDHDIIEFFRLCGDFVECLHLVTDFISRFCYFDNEIYEKYNKFHNLFTHCIRYFKNLRELEIEGNVFPDSTILELAKHCKNLKSISFSAIENQSFKGEHLHQLENIENLNLKCCHSLDTRYLLAVGQKRHLKSLNLLECYKFYEIPPILQLCDHWHYMESLVLFSPTSDRQFLKAIVDLPSLKSLQFNWHDINVENPLLNFEENFFLTLSEQPDKAVKLNHIKFTNELFYDHINLSPEEYAKMKENLHAQGKFKHWSMEKFNLISSAFETFKNLHTINFHYCRPLNNEQLIHLAKMNSHLKLIKIEGCPKANDDYFKKQWMEPKCQLLLESILTLCDVKKIYDDVAKNDENSCIERIICCQFD